MTVGENIRRLRKEKGLTQKDLGQLCGINEVQIRRYELGGKNSNPKLETLQRIAKALDVSLYCFLDEDLFDAATLSDATAEEKLIEEKVKSIMDNQDLDDEEKKSQLRDYITKFEIMQNMHETNAETLSKFVLNSFFEQLNLAGQEKAIEQVELLTKIPDYKKTLDQKIKNAQSRTAAHTQKHDQEQ